MDFNFGFDYWILRYWDLGLDWTRLGLALIMDISLFTPFRSLLYIYKESSGND